MKERKKKNRICNAYRVSTCPYELNHCPLLLTVRTYRIQLPLRPSGFGQSKRKKEKGGRKGKGLKSEINYSRKCQGIRIKIRIRIRIRIKIRIRIRIGIRMRISIKIMIMIRVMITY